MIPWWGHVLLVVSGVIVYNVAKALIARWRRAR